MYLSWVVVHLLKVVYSYMRSVNVKSIAVMWLLLALVGQLLSAAAFSCSSNLSGYHIGGTHVQKSATQVNPTMTHMNHSNHTVAMANGDYSSTSGDCCSDASCAMMSCSMAAVYPEISLFNFSSLSSDVTDAHQTFHTSTFSPSLYRPPIYL